MAKKKKVVKKKVARKKKLNVVSFALKDKPYTIEDGVTQSLLSTWVDCRQRAAFMLDGWQKDAPKRALQFGGLMHNILEKWYLQKAKGSAEKVFAEVEKKWRKSAIRDGDNMNDVEGDIGMAEALFHPYVDFWGVADRDRKWVEVEGTFDVEWRGFRLRGKRDGIYRHKKKGWLLETKTTSRIDEEEMNDGLNFNFQNLFYLIANREQLNEPIQGVLYNLVRKPGIKLKQTESLPEFRQRMYQVVLDDPEKYFVRYEVAYPAKRVKAFEDELEAKLHDFSVWLDRANSGCVDTYKNESACIKKWKCSYLSACGKNNYVGYNQDGRMFSELDD